MYDQHDYDQHDKDRYRFFSQDFVSGLWAGAVIGGILVHMILFFAAR